MLGSYEGKINESNWMLQRKRLRIGEVRQINNRGGKAEESAKRAWKCNEIDRIGKILIEMIRKLEMGEINLSVFNERKEMRR